MGEPRTFGWRAIVNSAFYLMGINKGGVHCWHPRRYKLLVSLHQVDRRREEEELTLVVGDIKFCIAADLY